MNNKIHALILSLSTFALTTQAMSPAIESPVLAKVSQSAGFMAPSPSGKIYTGSVFEIREDGKVFVTKRFYKNGKEIIERTQPLTYKTEDMVTYKKSIAQLKFDRALVVDSSRPILCDGGSTHFIVNLKDQEVTLQENNDCAESKIRQGRSALEVQVIKVMEDMLQAYYQRN